MDGFLRWDRCLPRLEWLPSRFRPRPSRVFADRQTFERYAFLLERKLSNRSTAGFNGSRPSHNCRRPTTHNGVRWRGSLRGSTKSGRMERISMSVPGLVGIGSAWYKELV